MELCEICGQKPAGTEFYHGDSCKDCFEIDCKAQISYRSRCKKEGTLRPTPSVGAETKLKLWELYFAHNLEHDCPLCNNVISRDAYTCGYIITINNGGSGFLKNLIPLCSQCNIKRRGKNLPDYCLKSGVTLKYQPGQIKCDWSTFMNQIPRTRQPISSKIRCQVWRTYFYTLDHACPLCNNIISLDKFDCSHMISFKNGGTDEISNLIPLCKKCNNKMSSTNLVEYCAKHGLTQKYYPIQNNTIESKIERIDLTPDCNIGLVF